MSKHRIKVFAGGLSLAAANGIADLFGLVRGVYLARVLPIEVLAGWNLLSSTAALGGAFGGLGEWNYLATRDRAELRHVSGAVFGFGLVKAAVVCLLTATLALLAWATSAVDIPVWAYLCVALVPLIRGVGNPGIGIAAREGRVWTVFAPGFVSQAVALCFAVAAMGMSAGVGDVVLLLLLIPVVQVVAGYLVSRIGCRPCWDPSVNGHLWRYGAPLLVEAILFSGSRWLELVVIGRIVGAESLAGWAAILVLIRNPVAIAQRTWMARVLPILADSYSRQGPCPEVVGRLVQGAVVMSAAIGVCVLVFAAAALPVVYAGRFDAFAGCLLPAASVAASLCFRAFLTPHVLTIGSTRLLARTTFLAAVGVPVLCVGLIVGLPLSAAAWGLLVGELLAVALLLGKVLQNQQASRAFYFGMFILSQAVQALVGVIFLDELVNLGRELVELV